MQTLVGIQTRVGFPVAGMLGLLAMAAAGQAHDPAQQISRFSPEGLRAVEVRSCLHHKHSRSCFSQGHGGHAATRSRANNNGVPGAIAVHGATAHGGTTDKKNLPKGRLLIQSDLVAGGRFELPTFGL